MRNFDEILRKDVVYDSFRSHKKLGLHPLFRRYCFGKTTGGGGQIDPSLPAVLGLSKKMERNYFTKIASKGVTGNKDF